MNKFFLVSNPNANNPQPPSDTCLHIFYNHIILITYSTHILIHMYKNKLFTVLYLLKCIKTTN